MIKKVVAIAFLSSVLIAEEKMAVREAPYGSWVSPITGDLIVKESIRFVGVQEVDGNLYWGEMRPSEKGRIAVMRRTGDGKVEDLLPAPYNARTRVYEYGGVSYLPVGGKLFFSNFSDQQLYRRDPGGKIVQLTHLENGRFADGCYDPSRNLLYYVGEVGNDNFLCTVDPETGAVKKIAEGADFYYYPRMSPDGKKLCYYRWNHPNLPWDGGELCVAEVNKDGALGKTRVVAGGTEESIYQPTWSPDGTLYFVSDRTGWWNFYREKNGKVEAVLPMEAEFGFPQWFFGMGGYGYWNGKIVAPYADGGFEGICLISPDDHTFRKLDTPFNVISYFSVSGDSIYFIGASATQMSSLVRYDLKKETWEVLKKSQDVALRAGDISHPQAVEFPTENGLTAHAFYYPPKNIAFHAPKGDLPPLVVLAHGGPTAEANPSLNLTTQYWTNRGIAVIDVNYGGSTGFGRAYRDRLKGNWGVVDVDDCVNAAKYCIEQGWADPNRLAITGGSAGGYTTLAALTFRDVFHVGASLFGISDLIAMNEHTHKFELHLNDQLIGPYPERKDLYIARSPLFHADQIKEPVLFLQGDEDAIVPPEQSEKMYEVLVKKGIPTAYILFHQEQHGFRQAANIKRTVEAIAYFFSQILGFKLADKIEPVKIENFDAK